jgi:RES domain-containing protein
VPDAWRIVKAKHALSAFDGEGARRFGGRWSSPGRSAVYVSQSLALATLEVLVHLGTAAPLGAYVFFPVRIPDDAVRRVERSALPPDWREHPTPASARALGDGWLTRADSTALEVPSAIVATESNYLLNPVHPDFARITVGEATPFHWDPRLRRVADR